MKAKITQEAVSTIEMIVNHGNKAVVQRKGQDVVIMEEKRKILYAGNNSRCEGDNEQSTK